MKLNDSSTFQKESFLADQFLKTVVDGKGSVLHTMKGINDAPPPSYTFTIQKPLLLTCTCY